MRYKRAVPADMDARVHKYWPQRYDLFSRFDEGVWMNTELWFSVTPESMAIFLSKFIKCCLPDAKNALDLFSGGGGNTIQFAKLFDKCVGIDINEENIECAAHNAEVYDVANKCEFINLDWKVFSKDKKALQEFKEQHKIDFAFASPPWGGPGYKNLESFDLSQLQPLPLKKLLKSMFKITENVILFLPRNSDLEQLSQVTKKLLGKQAMARVIHLKLDGRPKGICCFWGDAFMTDHMRDLANVDLQSDAGPEQEDGNEDVDEENKDIDYDGLDY
ncbi:RNA methyltransferase [Saccharomycopsis crataegensis]|uniref:Trimethylguanosine synthase n=1 Tax=Saccharomycopsis crataegensis TaxID=43959 RepID=A0AAV5QHC0_9ASCO|nr:RNA methyltransferase [Saccharomycopsis crataegensis]